MPDIWPIPGRPGEFYNSHTGRYTALYETGDLCTRLPLFHRFIDDIDLEREVRMMAGVGEVSLPHRESGDYETRVRIPRHQRWRINAISVPPWAGWRPSWEKRADPGRLEVKVNSRVVFGAPLLALADAFLGGAMAPAEGVTAKCDHCGMEAPRHWDKPICQGCGAALRLTAEVVSPHLKPAMRSPEAGAHMGRLSDVIDLDDNYDLRFILIPTRACPEDFECSVEIRGIWSKPPGC